MTQHIINIISNHNDQVDKAIRPLMEAAIMLIVHEFKNFTRTPAIYTLKSMPIGFGTKQGKMAVSKTQGTKFGKG